MKKFICAVLALVMVLSLAACGSKQDDNGGKTDVDLTAQEVLDKLKETLGDSYGCDTQDDEDRMTNYYGLDMSQVDSWASEASSMSVLDPSTAVVLKVKDGYADTAADLLRERYQQVLDYSKMYNMNVPMVEQARLFVSGNYVALLILGAQGDWEASDEVQAKFAAEEAAKVDEVWRGIFGSADNGITIPEEDDSNNNGGFFDMTDDEGNNDPVLGG